MKSLPEVGIQHSENLKLIWLFARLFVPLTLSKELSLDNKNKKMAFYFVFPSIFITLDFVEGTSHSEKHKLIWFFARLFVPLHAIYK